MVLVLVVHGVDHRPWKGEVPLSQDLKDQRLFTPIRRLSVAQATNLVAD